MVCASLHHHGKSQHQNIMVEKTPQKSDTRSYKWEEKSPLQQYPSLIREAAGGVIQLLFKIASNFKILHYFPFVCLGNCAIEINKLVLGSLHTVQATFSINNIVL